MKLFMLISIALLSASCEKTNVGPQEQINLSSFISNQNKIKTVEINKLNICKPKSKTELDFIYINGLPQSVERTKRIEGMLKAKLNGIQKIRIDSVHVSNREWLTSYLQNLSKSEKKQFESFLDNPWSKSGDVQEKFLRNLGEVSYFDDSSLKVVLNRVQRSIENRRIPIVITSHMGIFISNYLINEIKEIYPYEKGRLFGSIVLAMESDELDMDFILRTIMVKRDNFKSLIKSSFLPRESDLTFPVVTKSDILKDYLGNTLVVSEIKKQIKFLRKHLNIKNFYEDIFEIKVSKLNGGDNCQLNIDLLNASGESCFPGIGDVGTKKISCSCLIPQKYKFESTVLGSENSACSYSLELKNGKYKKKFKYSVEKGRDMKTYSDEVFHLKEKDLSIVPL